MKNRPKKLYSIFLVSSIALSSQLSAMSPGELFASREYVFEDVQSSWESALAESLSASELTVLDNSIWLKANLMMKGEGLPEGTVAPKKKPDPTQPVDPDAPEDETAQPEQQKLMRDTMTQMTLSLPPQLVSKLKKRQIKFQIFQNRAINLSRTTDPLNEKAVFAWKIQSVLELYQMAWILALESSDQQVKCQQFRESQILKGQLPDEALAPGTLEELRKKVLLIRDMDSDKPQNSATAFFQKICQTPLAFSKVEQTRAVENQVNTDFSKHLDDVAKDYEKSIETVLQTYTGAAKGTKVNLKTAEIFSLENRVQNSASKIDLVTGDLLQLVKLIGSLEKLNYESLGTSYKAPPERTEMHSYRDLSDEMFQTLFKNLATLDGCSGLSFPSKELPTDQVQPALDRLKTDLKQCAITIEKRLAALPNPTDATQNSRHQEFAQGVLFLTKGLTGQK